MRADQLGLGAGLALAAGLLWGLVFAGPQWLPDYPAALLSFGRYMAFGLIALPLAWFDRAQLRGFSRADWVEAAKLGLVGNIVYYLFLASAIQHAGGPLPTMVIGTLPVVIAITSNLRRRPARGHGPPPDGRLPWRRLAPPLLLIALGIGCVNQAELAHLRADPDADLWRYATGGLLALVAVACWTWYPLRNADWLRQHGHRSARAWATAQGLATLPLAVLGYGGYWAWSLASGSGFDMPLGPRPLQFVGLMLAIGLLASWLGTLCWNAASQRLPTALLGQLIVFETLSALAYSFALRGHWPHGITLLGAALLVAGVVLALRVKPVQPGLVSKEAAAAQKAC